MAAAGADGLRNQRVSHQPRGRASPTESTSLLLLRYQGKCNPRQNLNTPGELPVHIFPVAENQFRCFKCFAFLYQLEVEKKKNRGFL